MERARPGDPLLDDLREIYHVAERSADLTRQLLAFARKQHITPQVLDLNATVAGMLKMMGRLIGEDIKLAWQPGTDVWPVYMDPTQIDQVLANLCTNARDGIGGVGNIQIATCNATFDEAYCIDNPGIEVGEYVRLAVNDNGEGMDEETLSRIYEPFFTTRALGRGTGLGLATVYGIVKQNKGFIDVITELGEETTFNVYLPRHMGEAPALAQARQFETAARGDATILVVEDEAELLKLTVTMLEHSGYRVFAAASPDDAVRKAMAYGNPIDLLLTDVVMPDMNGVDLSSKLHELLPGIKTLFMSGYTADVLADKGVLTGATLLLPKPFTMKSLVANVELTLHNGLEFE